MPEKVFVLSCDGAPLATFREKVRARMHLNSIQFKLRKQSCWRIDEVLLDASSSSIYALTDKKQLDKELSALYKRISRQRKLNKFLIRAQQRYYSKKIPFVERFLPMPCVWDTKDRARAILAALNAVRGKRDDLDYLVTYLKAFSYLEDDERVLLTHVARRVCNCNI